ncbi:phage portal protein [Sphingomonas sp. SORGH_AS_0438]|uniref:phage portal protein n=1 Tax=Sphingomonas sp. SORGH_AS_0438 TaxID=3041756 RepID=UPI002863F490|nr:phage portal protein [Sphingomonas sp. SORGH_AS_0438]MDR6128029.1 PBSX family phage portal protein [Sphingomonas sp. SORGH_AS_0438]
MGKRHSIARRMARDEARTAAIGAIDGHASRSKVEAFTFGEPEPVLDRRQVMDMLEVWHNERWYEPPVSLDGLARAYRVSPHHSSAMILKRRLLVTSFEPTPWLSRATFDKVVQDFLVFGNAYLECRYNLLNRPMRLDHALAKYTRRGIQPGRFFYVPGMTPETEFRPGSVVHVLQPDVNQEIYGVPEYLSALQSALLNEAATLFRRRYYLNGSHAGYILYATGEFAEGDTDAMREALKKSKGPGNFRNLFVHAPAGKEGSVKILPIAEVGAKDEFVGIKNATQADVLAAHRVPPQLLGIVPAQGSAFGNPTEAKATFFELEIEPLQGVFLEVNDQFGFEAVRFRETIAAKAA